MAKRKKKAPQGAQRMYQLGYRPSQVWLNAEDRAILERARQLYGLDLATFLRKASLAFSLAVLAHKDRGGKLSVDSATEARTAPVQPLTAAELEAVADHLDPTKGVDNG